MLKLDSAISEINRVGSTTAKRLKLLEINTVKDLLLYFPFRYDDFSEPKKIADIKPGDSVNILVNIELIQNKKSFKRRLQITEALVSDDTGQIKVVWFNQPFIAKSLLVGDKVSLAGRVDSGYSGQVLSSPAYEKIGLNGTVHTQGLVPNYHLTANVTHKQIRYLVKDVIGLAKDLNDWLPGETIKEQKLVSLSEAIHKIHFPRNQADIDLARRRLGFDELFLVQLQAQLIKLDLEINSASSIRFKEAETKDFVDNLPFKLTNAQRKASWEIIKNLENYRPMSRLLEGDVGSGKTLVATMALLNTALNGFQGVLMVPTEILASQHFESLCRSLKNTKLRIGIITGSRRELNHNNFEDKASIKKIKKFDASFIIKNADIIVGTHALIQDKIEFNKLALAVIDEQHRFGVAQRKTLLGKSGNYGLVPHLLSMTATPIPRSLALVMYGDLDLSVLDELPANRKIIKTKVVTENERQKAYDFIKMQVAEGRQVFVVCPLIEEGDVGGKKSVKEEFERLDKEIFKDLPIGLMHGKLKPKEKAQVMADFLEAKTKVLVSTSVIEVGVDVPNASVMMIENAEQFGLAQLHQFRGRVGRGQYQSYCMLMTNASGNSLKRLEAMEKFSDGFALAKVDLKYRGPGEVYGTMQKGYLDLKIASLFDFPLMKEAKMAAERVMSKLANNKDKLEALYPKIAAELGDWEKRIHLE
ncbi:MAG: ATP-dependent DNA helicase RecG [bacterium]